MRRTFSAGTSRQRSISACLFCLSLFLISPTAGAAVDVDQDNDNLIEIDTLADLDEMRNDLAGTSLYGDSTGCATTCNGYELMADLDFDTNGDNLVDSNDDYWNAGQGWMPVGAPYSRFTAIFEGNGHTISNLFINMPAADSVGLLRSCGSGEVRNLVLAGNATSITGAQNVGAVIGGDNHSRCDITNVSVDGTVTGNGNNVGGIIGQTAIQATISRSTSQAQVNGQANTGGLAGYANQEVLIEYSSASGDVTGTNGVGGLVGYAYQYSNIHFSYATGDISGTERVGGLLGATFYSEVLNSYATGDVTATGNNAGGLVGQAAAYGQRDVANTYAKGDVTGADNVGGLIGFSYNDVINSLSFGAVSGTGTNTGGLIGSQDNSYTLTSTYWDMTASGQPSSSGSAGSLGLTTAEATCPTSPDQTTCKDGSTLYAGWGSGTWDFGTSNQYPVLIIDGVVHRDSDDDGTFDKDDKFPKNPAASVDADDDGLPDQWNDGCDATCQSNSGLTLDTPPNDPAPVANTGGPYLVQNGDEPTLDASGSTDNGSIVSWEWDLDNDGAYDDAIGELVTPGGLAVSAGTYTIGLRVTDDAGGSAVASTTVTVEGEGERPFLIGDGGGSVSLAWWMLTALLYRRRR